MNSYTHQRQPDGLVQPACEIHAKNDGIFHRADFIAAQSVDAGKTVTWVCVCHALTQGWNEGGDWTAPVFRIAHNPANF